MFQRDSKQNNRHQVNHLSNEQRFLTDFRINPRLLFFILIALFMSPELLGIAVTAANIRPKRTKKPTSAPPASIEQTTTVEIPAYSTQDISTTLLNSAHPISAKINIQYSKKDVAKRKHYIDNPELISLIESLTIVFNPVQYSDVGLASKEEYTAICEKIRDQIKLNLPFAAPFTLLKSILGNKNKDKLKIVIWADAAKIDKTSMFYESERNIIYVNWSPYFTDNVIRLCLSNEFFHVSVRQKNCLNASNPKDCNSIIINPEKIKNTITQGNKTIQRYNKIFTDYQLNPTQSLPNELKSFAAAVRCYESHEYPGGATKRSHNANIKKPGVKILSDGYMQVPAGSGIFDDKDFNEELFIHYKQNSTGDYNYRTSFERKDNTWKSKAKAFFLDQRVRAKSYAPDSVYQKRAEAYGAMGYAQIIGEKASDIAMLSPDLLHLLYSDFCKEISAYLGLGEENFCDRPIYCSMTK